MANPLGFHRWQCIWKGPLVFVCTVLLAAGGCVAGFEGSGGNPGRITETEVDELRLRYAAAYELVSRVRSQWLRPRSSTAGQPGGATPVVYVDGTRYGPVETLRQISMTVVGSLQYMNASDATTRFGAGHAGGAIMAVTLR